MARIPLRTVGQSLNPGSPVSYPSSLPNGLAAFGQDLAQAGQRIQAANEEKIQRENALAERHRRETEATQAFQWDQDARQFEIGLTNDLPTFQQNAPASGLGLAKTGMEEFDKRSQDLLKAAPPHLQEKARALIDTQRVRFEGVFAEAELQQRRGWSTQTLNERLDEYRTTTFNDPSEVNFRSAREAFVAQVDAAPGLTALEKEDLKRKGVESLSEAAVLRGLQDDPSYVAGNLGLAQQQPTPATGQSLVRAVIGVESDGDPSAVSPKGAAGLMQVMPATGAEIAREIGDASFPANGTAAEQQAYLKTPAVSVRYGTHYLDKMLQRYGGDVDAALIAYNGGPERADAWLAAGRDDKAIPRESASYYKKVRGAAGAAIAGSPALQNHIDVAKAFVGAHEGRDTNAIAEFIRKSAGVSIDPRQTAWCAYFLNAVFQARGVRGTGSGMARSFLNFGTDATERPQVGDVAVFSRGDPNGPSGHVGIIAGINADGSFQLLSGNSGDAVTVQRYGRERLLGVRRPPDASSPSKANDLLAQLPGGGPSGGITAVSLDPRYEGLSFSRRLALMGQAQNAATQASEALETQRQAEYGAAKDAMELSILTGDVTSEAEVLGAGFTDGDTASLLRTYRSQAEKATAAQQLVADYQQGVNPNWNPLDSADRKQANDLYDALEPQWAGLAPEVQQQQQDAFVRRYGIIPRAMAADMQMARTTTDPTQLVQAMQTADRIAQVAPQSFDAMDNGTELRKELESFRHLTENRGFTVEDAARRLVERRTRETKVNEEILGREADKAIEDLTADDVASEFDPGVTSFEPGTGALPQVKNALLSEYREAFRDNYLITGDADEAKRRAIVDIRKSWDVSNVSGSPQLMKFPPEKHYPAIDGSHDYLREDAMEMAKEFLGEGATIENIALVPATNGLSRSLTADDIRAKRSPRYQVLVDAKVDGISVFEVVPGTWAMPAEQLAERAQTGRQRQRDEALAQRSALSEGLDANESMGIRDFMMQGDDAPREPRPATPYQGPANSGRVGRYGDFNAQRPAAQPEASSDYVDPATMMRGVGDFSAPARTFTDPNSREGIAQRLANSGREIRRNAPR